MTDVERLAYHRTVNWAALAHFNALGRGDALAGVLAHAHLVRAVQAAERSGAWPMPKRLLATTPR